MGQLGGGGGGSWVISYSLYELRNVQRQIIFKQNRISLISSRLIEFWCFGLSAALGVGGAPHTSAHAHMHTHAW